MATPQDNAINRVLKAWGLGSIDEPGTLAQMAYMVDGHEHYMTLLRACDPAFRRDMYEAMTPHLRFKAKPLEEYVIAAKEHASAAQLPVLDAAGNLRPYTIPSIHDESLHTYNKLLDTYNKPSIQVGSTVTEVELWVQCHKCQKEATFWGERKADAIHSMRTSGGWAFDEMEQQHLCPECLDGKG